MAHEYGSSGRIGIGVPQANPTVEAEFHRLVPDGIECVATRLVSAQPGLHDRLVEYVERLDEYLGAFGGMRLDVFCFACTGSSYLAGSRREHERVAAAAARFGYPVVTATAAIDAGLRRANARRIAVLAPYPQWLLDAAVEYWRAAGYDVAISRRIATAEEESAQAIYALGSADALAAVRALGDVRAAGLDAVLLSGTGMPTVPALAAIRAAAGVPVVASNDALAGEALRLLAGRRAGA